MKKIISFFTVPDTGRLSEKAFLKHLTIGVIGILLCMTSLSAVSWALFHTEVSSENNVLESANCIIEIEVRENGSVVVSPKSSSEKRGTLYALRAGSSYTVTLTATGSADSGYCRIWLGEDTDAYFTQQVPTAEPDNSITFTLQASENTTVCIDPRWGSCSQEKTFCDEGEYVFDPSSIRLVEYD